MPLVRNYFSSRSDTTAIYKEYDTNLSKLIYADQSDISSLVTTTIMAQTDPSLSLQNDHIVWQKMKTALSWRISISFGDKLAVDGVRKRGYELSKKINAYMLSLK